MIRTQNFKPGSIPYLLNATTTAANGTNTQTLSAQNSSPLSDIRIANSGTSIAFVQWGDGSVTATSTTGTPVLAGVTEVFHTGGYVSVVSAVALAGSANVYATWGEGV